MGAFARYTPVKMKTPGGVALFCVLLAVTDAWPRGAPNCGATPGHGTKGDDTSLLLERDGPSYTVTVPSDHKGLVLMADQAGTWSSLAPGYRALENCITHDSRSKKLGGSAVTTFTPKSTVNEPVFSGFMVSRYSSYSKLLDPSHPQWNVTENTGGEMEDMESEEEDSSEEDSSEEDSSKEGGRSG